MNFIDFTKNGGYRFKQFTLRKLQEAYFQILKMFVAFCNVPDVGNFIISGCKIVGPNITAGYLYIDGELCYFEQTAGTLLSKIKKNVVTQTLGFKNGQNEQVFRYTNAVVDLVDGEVLSNFIRVSPVFDANYVHTDNNYTTPQKDKLATIETGAEVNVQADWDVNNNLLDSFIKNKPIIPNVLHQGRQVLGDFPNGTAEARFIIFPDVGTINYTVLYTLTHLNNGMVDTTVWSTVDNNKLTDRFVLVGREGGSFTQNLAVEYLIIAN